MTAGEFGRLPDDVVARGRPAPAAVISSFERSWSIDLPQGYRQFLIAGDGGMVRQYNEIEGTWHGGLREFFAIADADASDRSLEHVWNVFRDRVPTGFLPIADDSAGNLICIGLTGLHAGEVYFWDHELEAEEGQPPTMENMELLAPSLGALLGLIRLC